MLALRFHRKTGRGISCTEYAKQVEKKGLIPATESVAAAAAGVQSELGIQALHGDFSFSGKRLFLNMRTGYSVVTVLASNPQCQGSHSITRTRPMDLKTTSQDTVKNLLGEVSRHLPRPTLVLPAGFVFRAPCRSCQKSCLYLAPGWKFKPAVCKTCGGVLKRADGPVMIYSEIHEKTSPEVLGLSCFTLGLSPRSRINAYSNMGKDRRFALGGAAPFLKNHF